MDFLFDVGQLAISSFSYSPKELQDELNVNCENKTEKKKKKYMEINEPQSTKQRKIIMKDIMNSFPSIFVLLKKKRNEMKRKWANNIFCSTKRMKIAPNRPNNNNNNKKAEKKNVVQTFIAIHLWLWIRHSAFKNSKICVVLFAVMYSIVLLADHCHINTCNFL